MIIYRGGGSFQCTCAARTEIGSFATSGCITMGVIKEGAAAEDNGEKYVWREACTESVNEEQTEELVAAAL